MTNNDQILQEFREKFPHDKLGSYAEHALANEHGEDGECVNCPVQNWYADDIESFLLSALEQKDKALTEYKAELAETIQKKLTSSVDFLETEGVPYTEGFETALAEVLSLINPQ